MHQLSSQLADFLRLPPTPASSDKFNFLAVNRRVASSNLARGANFSRILSYLDIAIFASAPFCGELSRKCNGARFPYSRLFVSSTAILT